MKSTYIYGLKRRTKARLPKMMAYAVAMTTLAGVAIGNLPQKTEALVNNPQPTAEVSFTFDDAYASAYTQAAPILQKYGLVGTSYVPTSYPGSNAEYMTWDQVVALQNSYGWEIGSHTVNHVDLTTLTNAQKDAELSQSKAALAAHGITATDFASPEGDYDNISLAYIAKYYQTHRGFWDQNKNIWPFDDYLLNVMQVQEGTTVAQVESAIDQAVANKQWLVLVMHDIKTSPSPLPNDYEYSTAELDQLASYVKAKQDGGLLKSVRVRDGRVTSDTNLLPNATFNDGIAGGWTADSATITKDMAGNGSYPDPVNSIKMVAAANNTHLFSPVISVDPNTNYLIKHFLSVRALTGGEVGFYIDEYDANGNWISGQYKGGERTAFTESIDLPYKPSSQNVRKARYQLIVTGGSGITAYVDNVQWFPLQASAPTPQNLLPNYAFDNGISGGWTTDGATSITADSGNNGSPANPQNSVKMTAATSNKHLFSPQIAVDSTKTYSLSTYVNMKQITSGEVGFYIDEYDANGNWTSGQYKGGVRSVSAADFPFQYQPSSANVKKAQLQIINVGNSGILAYVDNAQWYQN